MKIHWIIRLLLLALPCSLTFGQGTDWDAIDYTITDLGHGIYRLEAAGGNIGLSVGEEGAFLIDAQYAPLAPKLQAAIAELTDKPVKFLINTHWHGDHIGGNTAVAATGAIVMAHDHVRARMAARGPKQAPAEALPVMTYSDATTFHLNGLRIHAFHVANAHTDGDTIVHFPDVNVIHAGDILFNGLYPFIDLGSGGSLDGYLAAMEMLVSMADDQTQIIAGHGPLGDKAAVERSIAMLKDAKGRVAKLVAEGLSKEEVLAADPLADYNADWAWRFITAERMTNTLYDELAGD
jgi:glyoxylase-like metal-dependent hydrolase (beta-lactamase superfamily II)